MPSTANSWVAIAAIATVRVPSRHSDQPNNTNAPPATGRYCAGTIAKKAPVTGVHRRPASSDGRP